MWSNSVIGNIYSLGTNKQILPQINGAFRVEACEDLHAAFHLWAERTPEDCAACRYSRVEAPPWRAFSSPACRYCKKTAHFFKFHWTDFLFNFFSIFLPLVFTPLGAPAACISPWGSCTPGESAPEGLAGRRVPALHPSPHLWALGRSPGGQSGGSAINHLCTSQLRQGDWWHQHPWWGAGAPRDASHPPLCRSIPVGRSSLGLCSALRWLSTLADRIEGRSEAPTEALK